MSAIECLLSSLTDRFRIAPAVDACTSPFIGWILALMMSASAPPISPMSSAISSCTLRPHSAPATRAWLGLGLALGLGLGLGLGFGLGLGLGLGFGLGLGLGLAFGFGFGLAGHAACLHGLVFGVTRTCRRSEAGSKQSIVSGAHPRPEAQLGVITRQRTSSTSTARGDN